MPRRGRVESGHAARLSVALDNKLVLIPLGNADERARAHILDSLDICAHNHVLSRKLLAHFSTARGPIFAIIATWTERDQMSRSDYTMFGVASPVASAENERPIERLVAFVGEYLQSNPAGIVVCENWAAERKDIAMWPWPPSQVTCFGDKDVYHVVTPDITDSEKIEAAVAPRHYWQTGICSSCSQVPSGDVPHEAWLDEIVRNTKYVFVPAFDGTGHMIWSPADPESGTGPTPKT